MKKLLHYSLLITSLLPCTCLNAQELVYEQDHGVSFNKGTINTDALVQLIQEKQEELNKFMLSNLMQKAVEDNTNSRLNNFATKYLIYETMNELTITADKSKFGKQTLELVKEAAIIFGISALVNKEFGDIHLSSNITGDDDEIFETEFRDSIGFNQTLDMVLNACIENPKLSRYFPLYSKLANTDDPNRVWYENDSQYWSGRDTLQDEYKSVVDVVYKVSEITGEIGELRKNIEEFPKGIFPSMERQIKSIISSQGSVPDTLVKLQNELFTVLHTIPQSLVVNTPDKFQRVFSKLDSICSDTIKIRQQADSVLTYVHTIKSYYEAFKKKDYIDIFRDLLSTVHKNVVPEKDSVVVANLKTYYDSWDNNSQEKLLGSNGADLKKDMSDIVKVFVDENNYGDEFVAAVEKLEYNYANWKRIYASNGIGESDMKDMIVFLDNNGVNKSQQKQITDAILKKLNSSHMIGKDSVFAVFQKVLGAKLENLAKKTGFGLYASNKSTPVLDVKFVDDLEEKIVHLHNLAERSGIAQLTVDLVSRLQKTGSLKGFFFEEEQVELSKNIMNYYIDYVSNSGEFSVGPVFLKTIVDNISYQKADSLEQRSASLSLNFESVLFTLNDKIVMPEWSYRTRRIQPFFQIGVNYANFVGANELNRADDGTTSSLQSMSYASEKIGLKYKWINRAYTRSFSPGVVYKWNVNYYSWTAPQKMPFINEGYIDFHAGGLLYNAVNLNTQENFNFPFAGMGLGMKTFNGLSISASYNFPFTSGLAEHGGWMDNGFVMLSLDVSIIEYIAAIRNK